MNCLRLEDDLPTGNDLLKILATDDLQEQVLSACMTCVTRALRNGRTLTAQFYKCRLNSEPIDDAQSDLWTQEALTAEILIIRAQQQGLIRNDSPANTLAAMANHLTNSMIITWCIRGESFDLFQESRKALLVLFNIA